MPDRDRNVETESPLVLATSAAYRRDGTLGHLLWRTRAASALMGNGAPLSLTAGLESEQDPEGATYHIYDDPRWSEARGCGGELIRRFSEHGVRM